LADRQYRHHHSHVESAPEASLIPSEHMKFVWKLIDGRMGRLLRIPSLPMPPTILLPLMKLLPRTWRLTASFQDRTLRRRPGTFYSRFFLSRTIGC
jgi:hypothetical protein